MTPAIVRTQYEYVMSLCHATRDVEGIIFSGNASVEKCRNVEEVEVEEEEEVVEEM